MGAYRKLAFAVVKAVGHGAVQFFVSGGNPAAAAIAAGQVVYDAVIDALAERRHGAEEMMVQGQAVFTQMRQEAGAALAKSLVEQVPEGQREQVLCEIMEMTRREAESAAVEGAREALDQALPSLPQATQGAARAKLEKLLPTVGTLIGAVPSEIKAKSRASLRAGGQPCVSANHKDVVEYIPKALPRLSEGSAVPGRSEWVLEERLGSGGFGEVWLAHTGMGKRYAVKFFFSGHGRAAEREARVLKEMLERIGEHPNIVKVYDAVLTGDQPWLAMEYLPGGDLESWALGARPGTKEILDKVAGVAAGLAAAHQAGVTHRDVKPGNILLAADGTPKLVDFGIARAERIAHSGLTSLGASAAYTQLWSSPEQQTTITGQDIDQRTDVFNLGLLLYRLLAHDLAAPATGWQRILSLKAREAGTTVPQPVVDLLEECLSAREYRLQHAGAFLMRLNQIRSAAQGGQEEESKRGGLLGRLFKRSGRTEKTETPAANTGWSTGTWNQPATHGGTGPRATDTGPRIEGRDFEESVATHGPTVTGGKVTRAFARLIVKAQPLEARITVKGPEGFERKGGAEWEAIDLNPGDYVIRAEAVGHEAQERRVSLEVDDLKSEKVVLQRMGVLEVTGSPEGARVEITGPEGFKVVKGLPVAARDLVSGRYAIQAAKQGYEPEAFGADVVAGRTATVSVALRKPGTLEVEGTPRGAKVEVSGPNNFAGSWGLPVTINGAWRGQYKVKVSREGYEPHEATVEVKPEEKTRLAVKLEKAGVFMAVEGGGGKGVQAGTDAVLNARWAKIPAGKFMMGSPTSEKDRGDHEKQHEVILTRPFAMMTTPVTQEMWEKVMGSNPSHFKGAKNLPVETVSWDDVQDFIKKVNAKAGGNGGQYRLPTEAEWEYACRAGTTTPFWTGQNLTTDQANYDGNYPYAGNPKGKYREKTTPVDMFPPNPWGLHDMHGNVWEWCEDWYGDYPTGTVTDPKGPGSGSGRVGRGGSWIGFAQYCRAANRFSFDPGYRYGHLGFRLLRS